MFYSLYYRSEVITIKRKIIIPTLLLTGALAVGTIGITRANAEDTTTYLPIVERLAERFGLNIDEVETVFEEERAEHHAEMLQSFEDRLTEAVTNGKITEVQKQAILEKHEEMAAKMEELRSQNLSGNEMHKQMRAFHEEFKSWAEDQGIEFPFMIFKLDGPRHDERMFIEKLN